jgi:hypothetical protein
MILGTFKELLDKSSDGIRHKADFVLVYLKYKLNLVLILV